jgi:hypothetical protein
MRLKGRQREECTRDRVIHIYTNAYQFGGEKLAIGKVSAGSDGHDLSFVGLGDVGLGEEKATGCL